jgi:hypothetical protein
MACPFVIGHSLPFGSSQALLAPAFMNGFSARPAALTTPMVALQLSAREMEVPEGNRSSVVPDLWATTIA